MSKFTVALALLALVLPMGACSSPSHGRSGEGRIIAGAAIGAGVGAGVAAASGGSLLPAIPAGAFLGAAAAELTR